MKLRHENNKNSMQAQRGSATLIAVILAGLGSVALALSLGSKVGGAQDQALAVHASTQSQSRAWMAAEAIRRYLGTLNSTNLANLPTGALSISGISGASAALISNTVSPTGGRRIVIDVTVAGSASSTILQLVFDAIPAAPAAPGPGSATLPSTGVILSGDTTVSGGISYSGLPGVKPVLYVKGAVNTTSTSLTGVDTLCATGPISIGANVSIANVCTNSTLTLTGGATITNSAVSIGNFSMSGGGSVAKVTTNGTINATGGTIAVANSTGNVTVSGGGASIGTLNTQGSVTWPNTQSAGTINANGAVTYSGQSTSTIINSLSNVTLAQAANANQVMSEGNITMGGWTTTISKVGAKGQLILANEGSQVASGNYGGSLGSYASYAAAWNGYVPSNNTNAYNKATKVAGYDPMVSAVSIPTISTFNPPTNVVDVSAYQNDANYAFTVDSSGKIKVAIKNINGIADGTYFLGKYKISYTDYYDYYCTAIDASGYCTAPAIPTKRIIDGFSPQNEALTYSAGTWNLTGVGMAPGVVWFSGNLSLGCGTYYDAFLATGNITVLGCGESKAYALNWGGLNPVCKSTANSGMSAPSSAFTGLWPTQLCGSSGNTYTPSALGNVSYMSGSYSGGSYVGGNITTLGGSSTFGTILAGNQFNTSGNTSVTGSIVSSGSGTSTANSMGGTTNITQVTAPSTFSSTTIPCSGSSCPTTGSTSTTANLFWSRYK